MALVVNKAGIYVSENICKFLKACNKSSILETKRVCAKPKISGLKLATGVCSDNVSFSQKLNFNAPATKFFGVDNLENLNNFESMVNHIKLNEEMAKLHCYSGRCTDIEHFKKLFFDMPYCNGSWETAIDMCTPHFPIGYSGIKMTFTGYKFNGKNALHSIGFIRDGKGQLFILDSLGNTTQEAQSFHKKLADIILENEKGVPNGIRKVIFNSKVQQMADELTCNNWTMANLKAVRDALDRGKYIRTTEELDRILPNDINKILQEQMELAMKSNYSISL